ncbi:unnamed protein product [Periconia digitata]|uniref:Uncharacterized protein n=1 Tax=Periconia digitata TaxID=1303443 RepID=A0A9W4XZ30_9PLEO|nr:unnamed protein product [Periconia digitata]
MMAQKPALPERLAGHLVPKLWLEYTSPFIQSEGLKRIVNIIADSHINMAKLGSPAEMR